MAKTIVFCADGTWNGPDQDEDGDALPDPTNVFKLFCGLAGELTPGSLTYADEQEKALTDNGALVQVAKYLHGVGDSRNPIRKLFGGAFGAGLIARIVRGYTFISRHYDKGDRIVIVGFSRGAYTARALAGLIAAQGVLGKHLTADKERAYRYGAQAWYRYRQARKPDTGVLQKLVEVMSDLPAFMSSNSLKKSDFVVVDQLAAVAVWDTVGAMGLPHYIRNPGVDAFKFTNTQLSPKVQNGFHAVALDEQRVDFTPTLWDAAANVEQMIFAGAHADVGGGYPSKAGQCGLSDIALGWMAQRLAGVGVRFSTPLYPSLTPDPLGCAHQPWRSFPFNDPARTKPRRFPKGLPLHPSVEERRGKKVKHDADLAAALYAPANWKF